MPLFFIPAIFAIDKLAYRLGRSLGSGAAVVAGGGAPAYSRPSSTTAWLGRCALSVTILATTYGVLSWLSPRMDTVPSLLGSWLVLLLLPRPTPRLLLMIARVFAMATSISVSGSSWTWAIKRWPPISAYEGLFLIFWWGLAFAMLAWSVLALRRRPHANRALVAVIPRPVVNNSQASPGVIESVEFETSHTHVSANLEWTTRFTRLVVLAQVSNTRQGVSRPE